mmetsp:Transcript_28789/g.41227  ORF Transcript_28789/g.41227 Transcript_28789/m.41227 type:complete len:107 (+) Transcript_28789:52-372(+)
MDVSFGAPASGTRHNFPPGVGALCLARFPETNRSPFHPAEFVLASVFLSGLSPLFWGTEPKLLMDALNWTQPRAICFSSCQWQCVDQCFLSPDTPVSSPPFTAVGW